MTAVRPFAAPDLPVPTGAQSANLDRCAIETLGVPESALMERAGSGAAALLRELAPGAPLVVLAGKGNNGGDALVLARCAAAWGHRVRLLHVADDDDDRGLLHGWALPAAVSAAMDDGELRGWLASRLGPGTVLVDGILGTGVRGAPRGEPGRVLSALEALAGEGDGEGHMEGVTILALDIPSGVDADTGQAADTAPRAHVTVAFGWPKMGSLLHPGRAHSGRVVALEIGFPPVDGLLDGLERPAGADGPHGGDGPEGRDGRDREEATGEPGRLARALTPAWAAARRPRRAPVTHKNRVGGLTVVGGRPEYGGAILLSARAGLRTGAGYVRIVTHPETRGVVQAALPEAVAVDWTDGAAVAEALEASDAVVVGPGLGTSETASALLRRILSVPAPLLLDADALSLLAAEPDLLDARRGGEAPGTVLTPHPGEAARLLDRDAGAVTADPWAAAADLRARFGCTVVLKGTPSVVLGAAGDRWLDTVGSSDLAQAGMGDTLAGAVGAFLAMGAPPATAAGLGLVTCGRAAARAGKGSGTQTGDVPEHIPAVLAEGVGETDLRLPGVLLDLAPAR